MHWGWRLVLAMAAFIGFVVTMSVMMMREKVDLVSENYYQKGLAHDSRQQALQRGEVWKKNVRIQGQPGQLHLLFPDSLVRHFTQGLVKLYRPSDAGMDFSRPMEVPECHISDDGLSAGKWTVIMEWTNAQGDTLLMETPIHIQ